MLVENVNKVRVAYEKQQKNELDRYQLEKELPHSIYLE
jgi:hypothetical protein